MPPPKEPPAPGPCKPRILLDGWQRPTKTFREVLTRPTPPPKPAPLKPRIIREGAWPGGERLSSSAWFWWAGFGFGLVIGFMAGVVSV